MKREIVDTLPGWMRVWWHWTTYGLDGWRDAMATLLMWAVVLCGLAILAPFAFVGAIARALTRTKVNGWRVAA